MWKKVINKEQLYLLQSEDVLIKYPIDGKVAEDFSRANPENISPRVITDNNNDEELMTLGFIHSQQHSDPILGTYRSSVMAPVQKHYNDIVAERIWWFFEQD